MISGDPFLLILALVSLLLWLSAIADKCRWQWGYLACFIVSIVGAYSSTQVFDGAITIWVKFLSNFFGA